MKKLLKPLLWSGLGLLGLTLILWGLGSVVAHQRRVRTDAIATEFVQKFPKTKTSEAAKELERLSAALGISSSYYHDPTLEPDEVDEDALDAVFGQRLNILFLNHESTPGVMDPIPRELEQYLRKYQAELAAIQNHLLTTEILTWDFDSEIIGKAVSYGLDAHLNELNGLLLIQAIYEYQQGDTAAMLKAIEASKKITQSLLQRPDVWSQYWGLSSIRHQSAILRYLNDIPPESVTRLTTLEQQQAMGQALNLFSWMSYRSTQTMVQDSPSWYVVPDELGYLGRLPIPFSKFYMGIPFPKFYVTLANLDTVWSWQEIYPQLSEQSICDRDVEALHKTMTAQLARWNNFGQEMIPDWLGIWRYVGRAMLELELTQKVLHAKSLAAQNGGQWPAQLPQLESSVCPGERWVYEVSPKGEMKLSFSHQFPHDGYRDYYADRERLPVSYSGLAPKPVPKPSSNVADLSEQGR